MDDSHRQRHRWQRHQEAAQDQERTFAVHGNKASIAGITMERSNVSGTVTNRVTKRIKKSRNNGLPETATLPLSAASICKTLVFPVEIYNRAKKIDKSRNFVRGHGNTALMGAVKSRELQTCKWYPAEPIHDKMKKSTNLVRGDHNTAAMGCRCG
jgi:hypothetical protein